MSCCRGELPVVPGGLQGTQAVGYSKRNHRPNEGLSPTAYLVGAECTTIIGHSQKALNLYLAFHHRNRRCLKFLFTKPVLIDGESILANDMAWAIDSVASNKVLV